MVHHMEVDREEEDNSCWASMPPELLRDVLARVEATELSWPARKSVVACAGVCSSWREILKELVRGPEFSGRLTFPISLKQPGPRDTTVQCFIKRDRTNSTYQLFLGGTSVASGSADGGKFLLAARKCRRATSTDYIISLDGTDMSRASTTYVGKLRSNFLGTKFTIYDSQPPVSLCPFTKIARSNSLRGSSKQVSPRPPLGSYSVASIAYELNVLGTRGPRRMQVSLNSIPSNALEPGGSVPYPVDLGVATIEENSEPVCSVSSPTRGKNLLGSASSSVVPSTMLGEDMGSPKAMDVMFKEQVGPLVLKNKAPRWHEQLQCWCLNFKGRVTVASVKNFQLVAANSEGPGAPPSTTPDNDRVLLQFGKIGKDMFTMDYRYPLSAFQAFAICLSSFDTKLACE